MRPLKEEVFDLKPKLVKAVQKAYDVWIQDDKGISPIAGSGGICHIIAGVISDVVRRTLDGHLELRLQGAWGDHVRALIWRGRQWCLIDVPFELYEEKDEHGNWRKLEGVIFTEDDVIIDGSSDSRSINADL